LDEEKCDDTFQDEIFVEYQFNNIIKENQLISFAIVRDIDIAKNGLHMILPKHFDSKKLLKDQKYLI
jgi:hypothetical protein